MKRFTKTIAKEFTSGFGRFIAIMAIIALGVGFMIGVMPGHADMKNSMDKYYEENAAFDLGLKSVYAFSEDDVAEVLALQDENGKALTERAFAYTSADAPVTITRGGEADVETIARVNAVDFAALQATAASPPDVGRRAFPRKTGTKSSFSERRIIFST